MRDAVEVDFPLEQLPAMCERVASTPFATEYAQLRPLKRLGVKRKTASSASAFPRAEPEDAAKRRKVDESSGQGKPTPKPTLKMKQR